MAKGKREFIIEVGEVKTDITGLKKIIEKSLKEQGLKGSEDIKMYLNGREGVVYCVVGNTTYKVDLFNKIAPIQQG